MALHALIENSLYLPIESNDSEFDDYQRHFGSMEKGVEKMLKDTKAFTDAVNSTFYLARLNTLIRLPSSILAGLFTSQAGFSTHFSTLFHPIAGEYDLIGKNPDSAQTIRNVTKYETAMEELRASVGPELELIESRIVGPTKELQSVMKLIRKSITKREHKVHDCSTAIALFHCEYSHSICIANRL